METRNNQTVAFTGHRKERILQGSGNDSRILAQIREAVTGVVTELYGQGYKEYYTGMALSLIHISPGTCTRFPVTAVPTRSTANGLRSI